MGQGIRLAGTFSWDRSFSWVVGKRYVGGARRLMHLSVCNQCTPAVCMQAKAIAAERDLDMRRLKYERDLLEHQLK